MPRASRVRLLLLPLLLLAPAARAEEVLADGIAAQVGSELVLVSEVAELVGPAEATARQQGATDADIAKLRADGLEQLIERKLIAKVVQDANLQASDADVDKAIEAIAQDNGLSLDQLRASLESHGLGWNDYRARIKAEVEREKVIHAVVGAQVSVDESEVRALYRQLYADQPTGGEALHVRQILVLAGEGTPRDLPAACAAARDAERRIAKGEAFESVAHDLSAAAPQHGGDIGWIHYDTMADWMKKAVDGVAPGQTSQVLELPFGCTLVQVVERKSFEPVSYEQAKSSLEQQVYERKMMDKYREWIDDMRKHTFIDRRGYFASAGAPERPAAATGPAPTDEPGATDAFTLTP